MRRKWHEQFVQTRYVDLFGRVATYWEKDDHDHRFNDCDRTGTRLPLSDLGIETFREQVPVTDPGDPAAVTYRTHRVSRDLQIWLLEGRDYRSPNKAPDGPGKTIWGQGQREWLQQTLLDSDAAFKIIISPTPMVGPDDAYKKDNHTNPQGFRHEGQAFFSWLKQHHFLDNGLYLVCGDRHWQYHSIHPEGVEEFSCGALVDANARIGRSPGDPKSTDPDALIKQPYTQTKPSGGFLNVQVQRDPGQDSAHCQFRFFDEKGSLLHETRKSRSGRR
jgi:alkaline phosphatase/alkaline phosphatase D